MHRQQTLRALSEYARIWLTQEGHHPSHDIEEEQAAHKTLRNFIQETPRCFERSWTAGHVTGSALITTEDFSHVLLHLHGKLGKWLQLGGHADGHPAVHEVALREAWEESGLKDLHFVVGWPLALPAEATDAADALPLPFDLDAHRIPARREEPEHTHYDLRYLLVTRLPEGIEKSSESRELRWFPLDEARTVTHERSMHRQFDKLRRLHQIYQAKPALNLDTPGPRLTF